MKHTFSIPMRLLSEANTHQHWRKKHERTKRQQKVVELVWISKRPVVKIPCTVTLTRFGPRLFDDDSLGYSFKAIRDKIADLILPGLAPGQADGAGKGIIWKYGQEKGLYGIRIEIEDDQPEGTP